MNTSSTERLTAEQTLMGWQRHYAAPSEQPEDVSIVAVTAAAVTVAMRRADVGVLELEALTRISDLTEPLAARRPFTVNELGAVADALCVDVTSLLVAPIFTCPAWCTATAEQHLARLWDNEGQYEHHRSAGDGLGCGAPTLVVYTDAQGNVEEGPTVYVDDNDLTRQQATALRDALEELLALTES